MNTSLDTIEYTERGNYDDAGQLRVFRCPDWSTNPNELPRLVTCKRRGCPRCGKRWALDVVRITNENLEHFARTRADIAAGAVVMVTITAPGEERLPWDEGPDSPCAHRRPHKHRGPAGCRVQQRAAREWSDTLTWRWSKLRATARLATQRELRNPHTGELGPAPAILARFYEPQKRGVPHLHVVLGYRTPAQRDAAHVFVGQVKRLVGEYDFGFADGRGKRKGMRNDRAVVERHDVELRPMSGEDAARYLANYLTGRNSKKKKSGVRENLADPVMPRSLFWITPALTSTSHAERVEAMRERLGVRAGTGVTMRGLRKARHVWAALEGRVDTPNWTSTADAIRVVSVYLRVYRRRPPPDDLAPAFALADRVDAEARSSRRWLEWGPQITNFAIQLVEACTPTEEAPTA